MATIIGMQNLLRANLKNSAFKIIPVVGSRDLHLTQSNDKNDSNDKLSFVEYIKLRGSLKTKQRITGVPFALTGLTASSMVTAYLFPDMFDATPDNVQLIMGLDPIVFCGICGVSASLVGYVIGTYTFKMAWSMMNKKEASKLRERDLDFLQRLEKHRFGKDSKFEDDYYGESIKTLSDYRQWVRTHQRKRETAEKFKVEAVSKLTG